MDRKEKDDEMKPRKLTKQERDAIRGVKKACAKLPSSLMFWAGGLTLKVVDATTHQIFERIHVRNDGGDTGSIEIDGAEFLDL